MKGHARTLTLAIAASLIIAFSVWAQQPSSSNDQGGSMQGKQMHSQKGSQNQMMQSCQKNMKSMMATNEKTTKDIEAAKQSNDPAKMRAALDEAEKALSPANQHMKNCMSMMNMMQHMNGMGGMMGDQSGTSSQPPKR